MSEKDMLNTPENVVSRNIVCGVIYNQEGLILLGKRPSHKGVYRNQWGIIGGGIDEGEDAETALLREIKEEAGLIDVVISQKIDFLQELLATKRLADSTDQLVQMRTVYYTCIATCIASHGQLSPNDEWKELRWMDKGTIKKIIPDLNEPTKVLFEKIGII